MDGIDSLFAGFNHWAWWIAALLLFLVELAAPGIFFLWLGIAAVATGFIALLLPELGWQVHVGIFAVLAVISAVVGRRVWKPRDIASADPTLNRRAAQYIGQTFLLQSDIVNGHGRMAVGDSVWLVSGPDLPSGTSVRVVGVDGARLRVEAS